MGIFGRFKKKESEEEKKKEQEEVPEGKYYDPCSLCGSAGTEKKWMGQYWHKKCLRKSKKFAKGMV